MSDKKRKPFRISKERSLPRNQLYRIGLYDPVIPWRAVVFMTGVYTGSRKNQLKIRNRIRALQTEALGSENHWCVGVFPVGTLTDDFR
jgi:hypothetical protein